MTFWWNEETAPEVAARVRPRTALRSRRGLLQVVLSCSGWLLVIPLLQFTQEPPLLWSAVSLPIWVAGFLFAAGVSTAVVIVACIRRSWGVAVVSLILAATGVIANTRLNSQVDYIDYQFREHRTELGALAADYRAGLLNGRITLSPDLRLLSPSGYAYADSTTLFIQMWQNWRAESGTGIAYFAEPPPEQTLISTAEGDNGHPQREVGDGWWWVS